MEKKKGFPQKHESAQCFQHNKKCFFSTKIEWSESEWLELLCDTKDWINDYR